LDTLAVPVRVRPVSNGGVVNPVDQSFDRGGEVCDGPRDFGQVRLAHGQFSSVSTARQSVQRGRGSSTAAGRVKRWAHGGGPPGRTRNDARPAWDETPPITPPSASSGRGRRSTRHGADAASG